jgi:hypothetical protein
MIQAIGRLRFIHNERRNGLNSLQPLDIPSL